MDFGNALVYLAVVAAVVGSMILLSVWLGPRSRNPAKDEPFECGVSDVAPMPSGVSVKYYMVGIVFLVFDVELAFLLPWAAAFRKLGWFGYAEMSVFLLAVTAGLVYAWKRGALQWD